MQNWLQLDIREKPLAGEGEEGGAPQPFNWLFDNNPLLKDIDQDQLAPEQVQKKLIPVTTIKIAADEAGYVLEQDGERHYLSHGDILEYGDKHIHVHYITPAKERLPEVMMHPAGLAPLDAAPYFPQQTLPSPGFIDERDYVSESSRQQTNVLLPMSVSTPQDQVHDPLAFLDAGQSSIQNRTHQPMCFHQGLPNHHQASGSFVPTRAAFSAPVYHQPQQTNHPDAPRRAGEKSLLADLPQPSPEMQALKDQFAPMHTVSPNLSVAQSPLEAIDDLFESQFDASDRQVRQTQEPQEKMGLLTRLKQHFQSNT